MTRREFKPGDVAVGDLAWGVGAWHPAPVIRVNDKTVTVGIHRDTRPGTGPWLTTERIPYAGIRGVVLGGVPDAALRSLPAAAQRVRDGELSPGQLDALADFLEVAGVWPLPLPVRAADALRAALAALNPTGVA